MEGLVIAFISLFALLISRLEATVPAIFIFGDSTADIGNNNFLPHSTAKANFPPNGIDFLHARPTGRFSNGLITADFLAKQLGFKRSPPSFLSMTRPQQALKGANFASAGSGILDTSGNTYGDRISLRKQIKNFILVRENFVKFMGAPATNELFSKSIFIISIGSNDLVAILAAHGAANRAQKTHYIHALVNAYKFQLRALYENGAKKIGVLAPPPIGCCPSPRAFNTTGGCLEDLNELSEMFYYATEAMLKELSNEFEGFKYSLGNLFEMVNDFFRIAPLLGFTELESACCGNGTEPCTPGSRVCSNRNEYLFWDGFHPTEAACKVAASTLFSGSRQFVSPINFAQLAADEYY